MAKKISTPDIYDIYRGTAGEPYAKYTKCVPVMVNTGRKWHGHGYMYDLTETEFQFATWSPTTYTTKAVIWDPAKKCRRYIALRYVKFDESIEPKTWAELKVELEAEHDAYMKKKVDETIAWCKSIKPTLSEREILAFARNVLKKRHPIEEVDKYISLENAVDVAEEVQSTLQWAMTLKTRPCTMYGRYCPGGKPYPPKRQATTAFRVLTNKGVTKLDGFDAAWTMYTTLFNLPDVR